MLNRRASAILWIAVLVLVNPARTAAQGLAAELPPPWTINTVNLDNSQNYRVEFKGTGDVWGTGLPAFGVKEGVRVGPFGLPSKRIGGFWDPCPLVSCETGVVVDYGLNMAAGVTAEAQATTGTLRVEYPLYVTINWPNWRGLQPGSKVTITTSYAPDRAAFMNSGDPRFRATLGARADMEAGIGAQAKVFGIPYPAQPFPGFLRVHENYSLFNTDQIFGSNLWTKFNIGPSTIEARIPGLGTTGRVGAGSDPRWLTSYSSDGFLNLQVNVTNLVSQSVLGFKLNDTVNFGPLNLEYHVLGLTPSLGAAAEQELQFEVRPRITFDINHGGQHTATTIDAGQSLDLTVPDDGSALIITPIINAQAHSVFNRTALFASAEALIDPLRVRLAVPEIDVSIGFNPFSGPRPVPIGPRLDLADFSRTFTLQNVDAPEVVGEPYVLSPDPTTPRLVTVCRTLAALRNSGHSCDKTLAPSAVPVVVYAEAAGGYDTTTEVHVNGIVVPSSPFGAISCAAANNAPLTSGQLCLTIPANLLSAPGALHVRLFNRPPEIQQPRASDYSNTIDLQVVPFTLLPTAFGTASMFQLVGAGCTGEPRPPGGDIPPPGPGGCVLLTQPIAGAGRIEISLATIDLVSRGLALEFITAGSTLLWDDSPLLTSIVPHTTVSDDNGTPVYTTSYDLVASVPVGLQTGGTHKLSFVNSGINADETVLRAVTIYAPEPIIDTVLTMARTADGATLAINGQDFMSNSTVEWDGMPHAAQFVSSNLLLIVLSASEVQPGDHEVVVRNPASGGSFDTATYSVPAPGQPALAVRHSLFRNAAGQIGDVISFTNTGTGVLQQLEIASVRLHVGAGGYTTNVKLPQTIQAIDAGGSNFLVVYFPSVGRPGQTAEIRVRAFVDGKPVSIDLPVVLPN